MKKQLWLVLYLLLLPCNALFAQPNATTPQTDREYRLGKNLRCMVCQNQSVADSDAHLAADLRREIHQQIALGQSDQEIVDYLIARYGDYVSYDPPFKPTTWVLWLLPATVFFSLLASLIVAIRRQNTPSLPNQESDNHD